MLTDTKDSIIQARREAADLINGVLSEDVDFRQAIKNFPQDTNDESLKCAFHALLYYDSDDEYRSENPDYADEQKEYLEYLAGLLLRGEDIPANIIGEYKKYYETAPLLHKKGIMYLFKSLFRFIS